MRWWKVERIWRIQLLFRRFLCVKIEIDQLLCVICWVINHSLSTSCKFMNHSRSELLIWYTLQLTHNSDLSLNKSLLELIYFLSLRDLFTVYSAGIGIVIYEHRRRRGWGGWGVVKKYMIWTDCGEASPLRLRKFEMHLRGQIQEDIWGGSI